MHAVIRTYSGADANTLLDRLESSKDEVERIMHSIPGFVSYSLVRTGEGGCTVTMCQDKAGIDEGSARAREWLSGNAADLSEIAPKISEGQVILHVK